jgi:hypothetical protein
MLGGVLALLKSKSNSLDEDEQTRRPRDRTVEERLFWPRRLETPHEGYPPESIFGEDS